jgi:hypothetical protein
MLLSLCTIAVLVIIILTIVTCNTHLLRVNYDTTIDENYARKYNDNSIQLILQMTRPDTFIVKTKFSQIDDIRKKKVNIIGQYKSRHKYLSTLFNKNEETHSRRLSSHSSDTEITTSTHNWMQRYKDEKGTSQLLLNVILEPYANAENVKRQLAQQLPKTHIVAMKNKLVIVLPERDTGSIISDIIAPHIDVHWIEPRVENNINNRGARKRVYGIDPVTIKFPLTGAQQIIGITDSGLDYNNCYFYDPKTPIPVIVNDTADRSTNEHQKIKAYWAHLALIGRCCQR